MSRARLRRISTGVLLAAGLFVSQARAATAGDHEALIQIGVEVVEVDEQKTKKLGIDWMNGLRVEETDVPALFEVGTFTRSKIFADIEALIEDGAADLLANPKLVARDRSTAAFHAGGELPYAVAGSLGTSTVEFKPYGINLKIHPQMEPNDRITLSIEAEVSGPDEQNGVRLSGNVVPAIRSRKVNAELSLSPGTTLTLAGLIQTQKEWSRRGVPGLMYIPLLGHFFSHKVQTNKRTSIVVFITPTLLAPGEPAQPDEARAQKPDELMDALKTLDYVPPTRDKTVRTATRG